MDTNNPPALLLFLTRNMSLQAWDRLGTLSRETAIYRALQERGFRFGVFSYGGPAELEYGDRLGARILCNHKNLPPRLYEYVAPVLHWTSLRRFTVFKTNQTDGALLALRCARLVRRPLIARSGYCWSLTCSRREGINHPLTRHALSVERRVFTSAARVVVTTDSIADYIRQTVPAASERIAVIPNFVDTELFSPGPDEQKDFDVAYVGRLHPEKNPTALLEAVADLPLRVLIVGSGPQQKELTQKFSQTQARIEWRDRVSNEDLPDLLRRSKIFAMPSNYEGHSKAILEAMACGLPVLGADSPGVRDFVLHDRLGWIVKADAQGIKNGLRTLLDDPQKRQRLGVAARDFVLSNFSFEKIVDREEALLREVISQ